MPPVGRRRGGFGVAAALGALVAGGATGAGAAPASVAWSTYLRAGPGQVYAAVSELEHDARVDVASCEGRWCRVSDGVVRGFVDRDALELPRTRAPAPPARTGCVVAGQADDRGPIATPFCSGRPSGG